VMVNNEDQFITVKEFVALIWEKEHIRINIKGDPNKFFINRYNFDEPMRNGCTIDEFMEERIYPTINSGDLIPEVQLSDN